MSGINQEARLSQDEISELRQLLQEKVSQRAQITDYRIANRQPDYLVILVSLKSPAARLVVKLAGPQASYTSSFERAAQLNDLVAAGTTITMPQIIAADDSCRSWPWRYLIKTSVAGMEWQAVRGRLNDQQALKDACRQIGQAVAEIHSLRFDGFGEFDNDMKPMFHQNFFEAIKARTCLTVKNERTRNLFLELLEAKAGLFKAVDGACLCHEDLHGYNILFNKDKGQWKLATVLDFDKAWSGHREIDLARMEFWDGMVGEGFWESYLAAHTLDDAYRYRRPIYQLLWCLEYGVNSSKHLTDTRLLCRELGIPDNKLFSFNSNIDS